MDAQTSFFGDSHPFFQRIGRYHPSTANLSDLFETIEEGVAEFQRNAVIWKPGARPHQPLVLEEGWAFHYKDLAEGERQICQLLLPGDILDGAAILPGGVSSTGVAAATPIRARRLNKGRLAEMLVADSDLAKAMWWTVVQTDNVFREHITRVGRQNSAEGLAHLLLEITVRGEMAGLIRNDRSMHVPLTQNHFADHLGITPVHVSRMMTLLKGGNFLTYERSELCITDRARLEEFAGFDPSYLTVGFEREDVSSRQ